MNKYLFTYNLTRTQPGDPPVGKRALEFFADNDAVAEDVASSWVNVFGSSGHGLGSYTLELIAETSTTVETFTY